MYKPLSREFLLKRGYCCNSGCINCPYKEKDMENDKKNKYEDMAKGAESQLAAALEAASAARQNKPETVDTLEATESPVPEKVESPAPDENEEMTAAEAEDIKNDIKEIRKMLEAQNRKLNQVLSRVSTLNSRTGKRNYS
tara:strand:+ start:95 stop:514 length:420 start_codon:yes stop_codon:yes gene_type:complete